MAELYRSCIIHGDGDFEIFADSDIGSAVVDALESRIRLRRTYDMANVLPVSERLYDSSLDNRPAVKVEIRKLNGKGHSFRFIRAKEDAASDFLEIARILGIKLSETNAGAGL